MKAKLTTVILILIVTTTGFGQQIRLFSQEAYAGNYQPISRAMNYSQITGSPYLNDDLLQGYVRFRKGDSAVHYLRYNIYADEMEYLDGEQLFVIDNEEELDRVYVDSHSFIYTPYSFRNSVSTGYLELLVTGKCKLYIKYNVDFEKAESAQSSYEKAKPDRFTTRSPQYYFNLYDQPISNFSNDGSAIETIGYDNYDLLKAYIKKQKLKLRKQEDLITLFNYYNTILK